MISRIKLIGVVGFLVIIVQLIGLPRTIKDVIFLGLGCVIIALSVTTVRSVRMLRLKVKRLEGQQGTFVS